MNFEAMKQARQDRHDAIQAERRTDAQNKAMVALIEGEPDGANLDWAYSSIDYTGEPVELQRITPSIKRWLVRADGHVTDLPTISTGL